MPLLSPLGGIITGGEAEVVALSRRSVVIQVANRNKLRLTSFGKHPLPPRHGKISFRCDPYDPPESTFMVFERLSGVGSWCRLSEMKIIAEPKGRIVEFRAVVLKKLTERFGLMSDRSLIAAFLLGDTDDLTPAELDAFRDMGLMHLFAVSGLNIALLFGILYLPFRFAGFPAVGSALGYAVATGFLLLLDFPVPLLRAWLFMTIGLSMRLFDRRLPPWTLLFLTAILVELMIPLSTFSMSFILSFGVTAAILIFYEPLRFCFASANKFLNILGEHIALTLAAGLPALVMGYLLFGTAQPLSLAYNLLLVPFSGLYLFASLVFLLFEPAKYALIALDSLYLKFAAWHAEHITRLFPLAEPTLQVLSLLLVLALLAVLYYLKKRGRLWSVRRNLRFVVPATVLCLVLPYFFAAYPGFAVYARPNKVWTYKERKIISAGEPIFADNAEEPRVCFPVVEKSHLASAQVANGVLRIGAACYIFTGRLKPEVWRENVLAACNSVDVFASRKAATSAAEWEELFKLFGYKGSVAIRRFYTWYGDKPAGCVKEKI